MNSPWNSGNHSLEVDIAAGVRAVVEQTDTLALTSSQFQPAPEDTA
jgi:hypothetical protein